MGLEREYRTVSDDGQRYLVDHERAVPHLYQYLVPSSFAVDVAHAVGAEGPATVVSTGCTSGLDSVGYAVELIRERSADIMIAGSTDAPISPITLACFDAIKATTPRNDDAEHASRPFDISRDGFVLGEGAAMFVLEDLDHARRRDAHIYAEIAGFGSRCNAFHMTGLRPDGREMAEAIRVALAEAGLAYLGLGTQPPNPSWGLMLREAQNFLSMNPWFAVFPGGAIALTVLGLNLLGDGLRDLLDPKTA